jgi:hypothetical protein
LQELVGHSTALYCQNHQQIQQLETTLAQYGYRDLYSPLPPDNPLDMMELAPGPVMPIDDQHEQDAAPTSPGLELSPTAETVADEAGEVALAEAAHRPAATHADASACMASPLPPLKARSQFACSAAPHSTLKAMAPLTAAKALLARADETPSSVDSPEPWSPSVRCVDAG